MLFSLITVELFNSGNYPREATVYVPEVMYMGAYRLFWELPALAVVSGLCKQSLLE